MAQKLVSRLKAMEDILGWIRDCPSCEGSGLQRGTKEDACHRCGGYGEEPFGDIMDAILQARRIVKLAKRREQKT